MPLIGCNQAYQYGAPPPAEADLQRRELIVTRTGNPKSHEWFQQYEDRGDAVMRFFIEPVALAAGYAKSLLGYKHVVMVGLSGGGWTTTVASAVVTDIDLSIPIAGSTPKWPTAAWPDWVPDLPEGHHPAAKSPDIFHPKPVPGAGGDFEQQQARPFWTAVGGYAELYVLAALEPHRHQLQILHEYDSCW